MTEWLDARTHRRALWTDVPLINCALYAWSMAHAELTNLTPARPDLAWSFVFPMAILIAVYRARWQNLPRVARRVAVGVIVVPLVLIALDFTVARPVVIGAATLRDIYEVSSIANTALLMVHAWSFGGWGRVALFLGPVALYGMLLENGGILLGYFSELEYRWYLGPLPAPMATMAGWVTVFYLITWITWSVRHAVPRVRRSVFGSACVATVCALLLDLQIDPLATLVGFWRWDPRLPAAFLGVPWLNFAAWVCAVMPFSWAMFRRENSMLLGPGELARPPHRQWLWQRVPVALSVAGVFFVCTVACYEGGTNGPGLDILGKALTRFGALWWGAN